MTSRAWITPLLLAQTCGCTMVVRPPADVREPATVYIADYHQHASLLLPRDEGTLT